MIVFCLIQQQMTDLIAHTPVIKVDPVYELHIPEKLESPVHCRQPDLGMFFRHKLIDILRRHMTAAVLFQHRKDKESLVSYLEPFLLESLPEQLLCLFLFHPCPLNMLHFYTYILQQLFEHF